MKKAFDVVSEFFFHALVSGMLFIGATYCFDEARGWALEALYKPMSDRKW